MKRILVTGSRNWTNRDVVWSVLDGYHQLYGPCVLIHGGAKGADTIAAEVATKLGWEEEVFEADWAAYGPAAGPIRNQQMLDEGRPDIVCAFPMPGSTGTLDMIRRSRRAPNIGEIIIVRGRRER